MSESRVPPDPDEFVMQEPEAALEMMYIEAYLRAKGHTLHSLQALPEEEARQLMVEASTYASTKLAEVETRAKFMQDIHGTSPSV